ncbi:MAG: FUSC family protein [Bacteroidota bacterium]|uniref:FUSC family protein n=1 Tax=Flagellimonas okinawensis TaxID=3031324 RepID=A0ABT5XKP2_9FLAO|nr:FUSC family protein [[Muricauda] okinawensis]MDF0706454.1 FUSC family protein [[Muricauda] okinawensis]MEC8831221.1 FUSC family protein [Bacteroidota bacterium]
MEEKPLTELTDQELLLKANKHKSYKTYDALVVGLLIGIAIYSTVKNGFDLLTFLPLIYIPIAGKNKKTREKLDQLIKERNLSSHIKNQDSKSTNE